MDTQRDNSSKESNFKSAMQSIIGKDDRNYYQIVFKEDSKRHAEGDTETILVDSIVMGVSPECQVRFGDDCSTISRRHAIIERDGNRWKLVHLSQVNNTYVNGQAVQNSCYLHNGDEIRLSKHGPLMGFIAPEGSSGSVQRLGSTVRIKLALEQAMKPYRKALTAVAVIAVLGVLTGVGFGIYNARSINRLLASYKHLANVEIPALREASDEMGRQIAFVDSMRVADRAQLDQRIDEENRKWNQAIAALPNPLDGMAGLLASQNILKDVYLLVSTKITYTYGGRSVVLPGGWTGTGFLLNDGRFVTARHCVEGWLYSNPLEETDLAAAARAACSGRGKISATISAYSTIGNNSFTFTTDDFVIDHGQDRVVTLGTDDEGHEVNWICAMPLVEGMPETMFSTDWAYVQTNKRGGIVADASLSRSLQPMQKLVTAGFPVGLGVDVANGQLQGIQPITNEMTVSRPGLAPNGCIMHSQGTDHGNSGGPIFALKNNKLVVVGIVSRGEIETEQYNWAVPICNINR